MNITRKEACVLNPLISEDGGNGTSIQIDYVLRHLQELFMAGEPAVMNDNEALAIYHIFGCVRGAVEFEAEVSDGN